MTTNSQSDAPRYAIYFAPAFESALGQFGADWMGCDPLTMEPRSRPQLPGVSDEELVEATRRPAGYGFHATLKAPFRMSDARDRDGLVAHMTEFAAARSAFELPGLVPTASGAFIALGARKRVGALDSLAADCVRGFEAYRAPLSDAERERRLLADTLSARQKSLLEEFGYPYVLDQFDFHITLAGPCEAALRDRITKGLTKNWKPLWKEAVSIDAIALFEQEPGEAFRITERFAFGS